MDMKQVASTWIAATVILTICLGVLSHLPLSGETGGASAQMNYTAPTRAALPRSWFEVTGSLPAATVAETVVDSDLDDGGLEIDPPDPSDFDLALGELLQ